MMLPLLIVAAFASGCATSEEDSGESSAADAPTAVPDTTDMRVLRQRAESGDPSAQLELASAYYNGNSVPQDYQEAVRWNRRAAEQEFAEAQRRLGVLYYNGNGVPQDYEEAMRWYRMAAEQENAMAQYSLGRAYGR